MLAGDAAERAATFVCRLLSTITWSVFRPATTSRTAWFTDYPGGGLPTYGVTRYVANLGTNQEFSPTNAPLPLQVPFDRYYAAWGTRLAVEVPDVLTLLLDIAYGLGGEADDAFQAALTLFNHGLDVAPMSRSLSFAATVSALETLVAYEDRACAVERCGECQQPRFRVSRKFQDFVIKFGYRSETPEAKRKAQALYASRSKLLHEGTLRLADDPRHPFWMMHAVGGPAPMDVHKPYKEMWELGELRAITRICFVNWLFAQRS
jgi:hypothetical protein